MGLESILKSATSSVGNYLSNLGKGAKDIIKREFKYEVLETLVSAVTAYAGYAYAGAQGLAGTIWQFAAAGAGYALGHIITLPFSVYSAYKSTVEAAKVALGGTPDSQEANIHPQEMGAQPAPH